MKSLCRPCNPPWFRNRIRKQHPPRRNNPREVVPPPHQTTRNVKRKKKSPPAAAEVGAPQKRIVREKQRKTECQPIYIYNINHYLNEELALNGLLTNLLSNRN